MSAIGVSADQGYLKCNHTEGMRPACNNTFEGKLGETIPELEARSQRAGWIAVSGFGATAHLCREHHSRGISNGNECRATHDVTQIRVWHDEMQRFERTGVLDQGPCLCSNCIAEELAEGQNNA